MTPKDAYHYGHQEAFRVGFDESGMTNPVLRRRWQQGWNDAQRGLSADPFRPRTLDGDNPGKLRAAGYDVGVLSGMSYERQRAALREVGLYRRAEL